MVGGEQRSTPPPAALVAWPPPTHLPLLTLPQLAFLVPGALGPVLIGLT